ncbi:hypothetical protein KI387_005511, partial [Taxus chinensis]
MDTLLGSLPLPIANIYSKYELRSPSPSVKLLSCNAFSLFINTHKLELSSQTNPWQRIRSRAQNRDKMEEAMEIFEEDGSIKDMDGYLNALSLEYDSVWDTKPAWCQPWTIGLTGVLAVGVTWILFESVIWTTIVASLVGAWWYIFLYSYPQ